MRQLLLKNEINFQREKQTKKVDTVLCNKHLKT